MGGVGATGAAPQLAQLAQVGKALKNPAAVVRIARHLLHPHRSGQDQGGDHPDVRRCAAPPEGAATPTGQG